MSSPDSPQQWQEAPAQEGRGSLAGTHHGFLLQGLPTVFSLWPPWLLVLLNHMGLSLILIGAPADGYQTLLFAVFFPAPLPALLSRTAPRHVFLLLPLRRV